MSDAPEIRRFVCWARYRDEGRRPRWSLVSAWTAADAIAQSELRLRSLPELVLTQVEPYEKAHESILPLRQEDRW